MIARSRTPDTRGRRTGGYWPKDIQEVVLRAAVLDGSEALDAWHAIEPRLDAVWADRPTQRLIPLLGANLRRLGVDAPFVERADALRQTTGAKNRSLFDAGRRLLTTLAAAGIDTLMLKGGVLVVAGYRDLGLRPMSDLDVVVPTARAAAALEAVGRTGWAPRDPVSPAFIQMQHATDVVERDTSLRFDLHWHVYWECCGLDADDELWAASAPLDFEGVATRTLAPADQLLHLCVHGSRRTRRPSILWVPDALQVLRSGGIDWARLVSQARRRQFVLRSAMMLAYLRHVFGAPVPDGVLTQLDALHVSRLERLEYWVGNQPQGLLGELPSYWCNYRRLCEGGQITARLGFPRYLQQIWKLQSLRDVGAGALSRARNRVRAAVLRSPHAD